MEKKRCERVEIDDEVLEGSSLEAGAKDPDWLGESAITRIIGQRSWQTNKGH